MYSVCQRDPQNCIAQLAQNRREQDLESRYGRNHFLGRPCFGRNFVPTSANVGTTGEILRGFKSNRGVHVASERRGEPLGCNVNSARDLGYLPRRVMTESGRVRSNLKSSVFVDRSSANSLCPPEYVSSSLSSAKLFHERVSRTCESLSGSYLACTFKVCAIFEN